MAWNNLTVPTANAEEFQQILDTAYKNYQDSIENLIAAATDEIETAINRNDMALKEIVREYTDDASQLARDYYHTVRQAWQEYTGQEFPGFDDGGLIDTDRILWQTQHGVANTDYPGLKYRDVKTGSNKAGLTMDDLWPDMTNIDDAQQFIGDMIRNALRSQTQQCMRRDPTQPRWARVPQDKTCAFCVMLASRGFAYLSDETAGKDGTRFHDDCDCRIVPSWGRQSLKGYDLAGLRHAYEQGEQYAAKHGMSRKHGKRLPPDDVVKAMRRIPGLCTDSCIPEELQLPPGRRPKDPDKGRIFNRYLGDRSILEALAGANPNYEKGKEYQYNCQRCVIAYEMRRRGYAVSAKPRELTASGGLAIDPFPYSWMEAFVSTPLQCGNGTGLNEIKTHMESWGLSSRAIIFIQWEGEPATTHVFIAENLRHGVRFLDPQTGEWDVHRYFDSVKPGKTAIMRIDDAHAIGNIVRQVCEV